MKRDRDVTQFFFDQIVKTFNAIARLMNNRPLYTAKKSKYFLNFTQQRFINQMWRHWDQIQTV